MKQLLICSCLLLVIACTTDSYETGEGRYSQTTADFAELRSNGQKQGISFLTDDLIIIDHIGNRSIGLLCDLQIVFH